MNSHEAFESKHNKHRRRVYPEPSKISRKLPKSILSKARGGRKDVAEAWEGELDRDDIPKVHQRMILKEYEIREEGVTILTS